VTSHIVAIGGRGLDRELTRFVLALARGRRACFLPTPSGDDAAHIVAFYDLYLAEGARATHLELFHRTVEDLRAFLLAQDVIYVSGGNTANALAIWRVHGVDAILREAHEAGIVLCGSSAGCICWFEASITDSFGLELAPLRDGLGLLRGSACPHYDSEERRRPVYTRAVADGLPAGLALEDGVAAHYVDGELHEIVTVRDGAHAYRVERDGASVVERPLLVRRL